VHALIKGRPLILGGVNIPHEFGLLGHSDADVLTHAVMDALLGALALGDIGRHFPDTDERYRNASSLGLLREVTAMVRERGYQVANVDAIVVAQSPKLAPFIDEMRQKISETMGIAKDQVSVKATTTEKLGFEGREEGISAQAIVLLVK